MDKRDQLDEFAEKIIRYAKTNGVWEVRPNITDAGVSVQYTRTFGTTDVYQPGEQLGFYVIFDDWCLNPVYVGRGIVSKRIYRFFKEIVGKARHDETHPAATKYKSTYSQEKINNTRWSVAIVWDHDLEEAPQEILNMADERVAEILGSRFNRRTIGNSLPI